MKVLKFLVVATMLFVGYCAQSQTVQPYVLFRPTLCNGATSGNATFTGKVVNNNPNTTLYSNPSFTTNWWLQIRYGGIGSFFTIQSGSFSALQAKSLNFSGITYNANDEFRLYAQGSGLNTAPQNYDPTTVDSKNPPLAPTIIASDPSICSGSGALVTLTANGDGGTYTWSTAATGTSIYVPAGSYTVHEDNACGTSPESTPIVITTITAPTKPSITLPSLPLCNGASGTLTASGSAADVYAWYLNATLVPGQSSQTISVTTAGSYTVTETSTCGTSVISDAATVTTSNTPSKPSISASATTICNGSSATLTAIGAGGTYAWSNGATGSSTSVSTSGSYTVTETNSCATSDPSDATTIYVSSVPLAPSINASGSLILCDGAGVTLSATPATIGGIIHWSNGATGNSITVSIAGSYTAYESNPTCGDGPSSTAVEVITATTPDIPTISSLSTTICNNNPITLTSSGSNTITWYLNGSSTGANGTTYAASDAGNYTAKQSNLCGTSDPSNTIILSKSQKPSAPTIVSSSGTLLCNNATTTLSTIPSGGGTIHWSNGATGNSIIVSIAGSYYANEVTSCETSDPSNTITLFTNSTPVVAAINGVSSICMGGTAIFSDATAGGSWSSSNTNIVTVNASGDIVPIAPGSATIYYSLTNSCATTTVEHNISVQALPSINISASLTNTTVTLVASGANTYSWSSGENVATIAKTTLSAATYTVTGTDLNSCVNQASYSINIVPNSGSTSINSTLGLFFCQGASTTLTASTGDSYYWSTGATTRSIVTGVGGTYSVTVAHNATHTIENATITLSVSPSTVGGTLNNAGVAACYGANSGTISLSGYVGNINYWEYSTNGGLSWNNIVNTSETQNYNNLTNTTLYRAQVQSGTCPQVASSIATITVDPIPTVNTVSNQTICNNTVSTAIIFTGAVTGTTYSWTNNNTAIGLGANGSGNIASFTATNSTTAPISGTITVTPSANGCIGTPITFTITVNPTPTVATVTNQTLCNNSSTSAITFSGAVSGSTYSWSNNAPTIGIPISGSGNIASFTAINNTTAPIIATITVTPSANGCTGAPITFAITVNPTATLSAITDQLLCSGTSTIPVTFAGAVSGTTYSWTNNNTAIGLGASGTGNIPFFTATNNTTANILATITTAPAANGCSGTPQTFSYTIYPTPVMAAVSSQILCNGVSTNAVIFSSNLVGTTYAWTNSNTTVGLTANGAGNIGSFVAHNFGTAPVVASMAVVPLSPIGCYGSPIGFSYIVNPIPTANTISNQTICNNANTTTVTLTGAVSGTTYAWTNTNTAIGLGTNGSGDINSFTATNSTTAPISGTITVTPSANGCSGAPITFTLTVNPTPTVNTVSNQTICNNTGSTAINFSGAVSGTTYSWTNTNTSIGLGASGSGNIASFTATNSTTAPITATITVTPSANGCIGTPITFNITVNPTPTVNAVTSQVLCNNTGTTAITFSGAVSGTTYSWTNTNTAIGLGASGSGNIASFTATNATSAPIIATITPVPSANGCNGSSILFTVTVNPTPYLSSALVAAVCDSTVFFYMPTAVVTGSVFTWTRATVSGIANVAASGSGIINEVLSNNTNADVVVTYQITILANGCSNTQNLTVTVHPTPFLVFQLQPPNPLNRSFFTFNNIKKNKAANMRLTAFDNLS